MSDLVTPIPAAGGHINTCPVQGCGHETWWPERGAAERAATAHNTKHKKKEES